MTNEIKELLGFVTLLILVLLVCVDALEKDRAQEQRWEEEDQERLEQLKRIYDS